MVAALTGAARSGCHDNVRPTRRDGGREHHTDPVFVLAWTGNEEDTVRRRVAGRRAQDAVSDLRKQAKDSVAKRVVETVRAIAVRSSMTQNAEQMSKRA